MTVVQEDLRDLRQLAEQAGRDLENASPLDILKWATSTFGSRFCVTSNAADFSTVYAPGSSVRHPSDPLARCRFWRAM